MHPLFREPLRYDALTWLWLVLVAGVYVLHLRLSTWVSAWAFILAGVVVSSAFVLLVALIRYLVDGPQRRVEGARTMREVLGIDVLPGVGEWVGASRRHPPPTSPTTSPTTEPDDVADTVVVEVADTRPVAALVDERDEVTVRLPVPPVVVPEPRPGRRGRRRGRGRAGRRARAGRRSRHPPRSLRPRSLRPRSRPRRRWSAPARCGSRSTRCASPRARRSPSPGRSRAPTASSSTAAPASPPTARPRSRCGTAARSC